MMNIILIILIILLILFSNVYSKNNVQWEDIKLKDGVIRDIIYPKSTSTSGKGNKNDNLNNNNNIYIYGPTPMLPLSSTCIPITSPSMIPDDMSKTGKGRASKDLFKNVTLCPLVNVTTHRGGTGKTLKTYDFGGYERNVIFDTFEGGGGPEVKGIVGRYTGKGGKVEVRCSFDCREGGGKDEWGGWEEGEGVGGGGEGGLSPEQEQEDLEKIELRVLGEKDGVLYTSLSLPFSCNSMESPVGWREEGIKEIAKREEIRKAWDEEEKRTKEREKERKGKGRGGGSCPKCPKCEKCKKCKS